MELLYFEKMSEILFSQKEISETLGGFLNMINSKTCHDNLQQIGSQSIPTDMMHVCPRNLPIFCVNLKKSIDGE